MRDRDKNRRHKADITNAGISNGKRISERLFAEQLMREEHYVSCGHSSARRSVHVQQ